MALSIGIVGAGAMGAGIAHFAALHKCTVALYDINEEVIRRGIERVNFEMKRSVDKSKISEEDMKQAMQRIKKRMNINDLDTCDIIIEAVLEDVRVKKDLLKKLDAVTHHTTILATTTSTIPLSVLASAVKKPERIIGTHFFHPAHSIPLVEVVHSLLTSQEVFTRTMEAMKAIGKVPLAVKDSPGFIVNRISSLLFSEALKLVQDGVAPMEIVDTIVKGSGKFNKGPFEWMDAIGNDAHFSLMQSLFEQFAYNQRFAPSTMQKHLVEAGLFGKKTHQGFYTYEER